MFASVLADLDTALDQGFAFADSRDAAVVLAEIEQVRRKTAALAVAATAAVERAGVYGLDGHASAKVMVRHVAKLTAGEAAARERGVRMDRWLPDVAAALAAGTLGVAQYELLGRVYANPRVRAAMIDAQHWFLDTAEQFTYPDFEAAVREWERLADMDGAARANQRNHENRNVTLVHSDIDLSWELRGSFAALQGASIDDIFAHYLAAERLADWDTARADHGDDATDADLARTEGQRRADALWKIFQDAASADDTAVPAGFCHDIIWSEQAYQAMLAVFDGQMRLADVDLDGDQFRCSTIDGVALEPVEAAAASLTQQFRRVIVDAAGVTIDLGRQRCFTGSARKAVQLSATHCPWPGCWVPTSQCEIDHTHDHAKGGRTNPHNGGPFCARHNRWKQKGFTVWRDPTGQWHTHRPDGTQIE